MAVNELPQEEGCKEEGRVFSFSGKMLQQLKLDKEGKDSSLVIFGFLYII